MEDLKMKTFISIFTVFAIALILFTQSDSFAKTERQATKRLSVVNDSEVYNVQKPQVFKHKTENAEDEEIVPRLWEKFTIEISSFSKRARDWWKSVVLPVVVNPKYDKSKYLHLAD